MALKQYRQKRDFKKTPEPKEEIQANHQYLFVVQKHAASHLHYDFRLELNGVLKSWAVPKGPCLDPTVKRLAMHVEDHPIAYGAFEGIIPKGQYGGGTVMLWDQGEWLPLDDNPAQAYHNGHLSFELKASKLKGRWSLIRFKKEQRQSWFLVKYRDQYAKTLAEYDITIKKPKSVLSKQSMDEIAENAIAISGKQRSPYPKKISPQLATLVDKPPSGKEWLHEIKFDGYRILAFKNKKNIQLLSRNNHDWTNKFMNVVNEIKKLSIGTAIFDGEVVLLDDAEHSNFQLLQNALKDHKNKTFIYYIFDLLYCDQYNLQDLPLIERKTLLQKIIGKDHPVLRYSDHIIGNGQAIFTKACQLGLEGIVSKHSQQGYEQKRSQSWLKTKCTKRQEFVVGGYTKPKGAREFFGSLLLGVYNAEGKFVYCGHVGTGFSESSLRSLHTKLQKYTTLENPFNSRPPGVTTAKWLKPILVAEVEFAQWTNEGILRHASFKRLTHR